jgi:signal transduction histidine kinase
MAEDGANGRVGSDLARCLRSLVHDLNNHLALISGQAQLIRLKASATEHDELAAEVSTRAGHILDAVSQCQAAFARLRPIYAPEAPSGGSVPLDEVCTEAVARLGRRHCGLAVEVTPPPAVAVAVGRGAAVAALHEVLDNAARAVATGGSVRLSAEVDGRFARVRVDDNGVGLSADQLDRVFDTFAAAWPAGVSTGLGLTLARSLLESCGGGVGMSSPGPGRGASCTLVFPLVQS